MKVKPCDQYKGECMLNLPTKENARKLDSFDLGLGWAGTSLLQEHLAMEIPQGDLGTLLYMTWNPITRDEQNSLSHTGDHP